jgi:hypothetical protein
MVLQLDNNRKTIFFAAMPSIQWGNLGDAWSPAGWQGVRHLWSQHSLPLGASMSGAESAWDQPMELGLNPRH